LNGETFSIGEVALFVREGSRYYGTEVMVVGPCALRPARDRKDGALRAVYGYEIDGPFERVAGTNGKFIAEPHHLRKRRPPQDWQALCNLTDKPVEAPARELEIA
jgi:hypothetical protein